MPYSCWQVNAPQCMGVVTEGPCCTTEPGVASTTTSCSLFPISASGGDPVVVQERSGQGVSVLHFLSPPPGRGGSARARTRPGSIDTGDVLQRFHIKSDTPMSPQCGLCYMECAILRVGAQDDATPSDSASSSVPPALVIGICRESLPFRRLPGEELNGIGLFPFQRLVYHDGCESESIRLPLKDGNSVVSGPSSSGPVSTRRHISSGDTVGCLVNFVSGTVHFILNGALLTSYTGKLSENMPYTGYFMALGIQRRSPAFTLRVSFLSDMPPILCGKDSSIRAPVLTKGTVPRPLHTTCNLGDAGGESSPAGRTLSSVPNSGVSFDLHTYSRGEAQRFVRQGQPRVFTHAWGEGDLDDVGIAALLRQYFASRGLQRTAEAYERELRSLCPEAACLGASEGAADTPSRVEVDVMSYCATMKRLHHLIVGQPGACEEECNIDLARGAHTLLLLTHTFLSPALEHTLSAVLGIKTLGTVVAPRFWALHLLAKRQDVLYVLKSLQAVEAMMSGALKQLRHLTQYLSTDADAQSWKDDDNVFATASSSLSAKMMTHFSSVVLEPLLRTQNALKQQNGTLFSTTPEYEDALANGGQKDEWGSYVQRPSAHPRALFFRLAHSLVSGDNRTASTNSAPDEEKSRAEEALALLISAAVPAVAAPRTEVQVGLGQSLCALLTRLDALQQHVASCGSAEGMGMVKDDEKLLRLVSYWRRLLITARRRYRHRAWIVLLHSIETFNESIGRKLSAWQQEEEINGIAEKVRSGGSGSGSHGGNGVNDNCAATPGTHEACCEVIEDRSSNLPHQREKCVPAWNRVVKHHPQRIPNLTSTCRTAAFYFCSSNRLADSRTAPTHGMLPICVASLQTMWRRVHAVTALQPLLHMVAEAFAREMQMSVLYSPTVGCQSIPEEASADIWEVSCCTGSLLKGSSAPDLPTQKEADEAWVAEQLSLVSLHLKRIHALTFFS